jgi:FkbM family methyltransferase
MNADGILDLDNSSPASGLDLVGRCLLRYARSPWPGRRSALRKFRRRFLGKQFIVRTRHGFRLAGVLGDSVDTECAVHLEFEPGLSKLLGMLARQMESFIDVGCNIGYFTCLVAARGKASVLAVDANPVVLAACRRNLELNQLNARLVHAAVGEANRETVLHVPRGRATLGTLGNFKTSDNVVDSVAVEMRRFADLLDGHDLKRVDLVKIDIEGYESCLFRSMNAATARRCEAIVFEFSEANLAQCGRTRRDFEAVEWMGEFDLYMLDERTGRLRLRENLQATETTAATLLLWRKTGPRRLELTAWIEPD